MESIIAVVVLALLAVPIILVTLAVRLSKVGRDLESVARRLAHVELELHSLKNSQLVARETEASAEALAERSTRTPEWQPIAPMAAAAAASIDAPPKLPLPTPATPSIPPYLNPAAALRRAEPLADQEEGEEDRSVNVPPLVAAVPKPAAAGLNWEQFMGGKLFAWIGGFALFLGIAFFIKYSFEHNWIPPSVRVAIGFAAGVAMLVGGVLLKRRELAVTSQTLCATGVVVLYAVTFACHSVYHFPLFNSWVTFVLMAGITAVAFTLAVQLMARVVAVLGLVGGFLTPILLSTGQDNPAALFSYIALLDVGLVAVAFRRQWHFLIAMAAAGTVVMQQGWCANFFVPEKAFTALVIFSTFCALFLIAFAAGEKLHQNNRWLTGSAAGLPLVTLIFNVSLLSVPVLSERPGLFFSFTLVADVCLLAMTVLRPSLERVHLISGTLVFALLSAWTLRYATPALLVWALGLCLGFAALHSLFPLWLARRAPEARSARWSAAFPAAALVLVLLPLAKEATAPWLVWPGVLLVDALAFGVAIATGSVAGILAALVLTLVLAGVWFTQMPPDLDSLSTALVVVAGFALFFFFAATWAARKMTAASPSGAVDEALEQIFPGRSGQIAAQIPAASSILPFLLLILLSGRVALPNPTPLFGVGMLLVILTLAATCFTKVSALPLVSLASVLALEYAWHADHFLAWAPLPPLLWYLSFCAVFGVFPFLFRSRLEGTLLPWCASALSAPLHFFLIYRAVKLGYPNGAMGLLPAAFAIPMLLALTHLHRTLPHEAPRRVDFLAWFGGAALFFITLIFPIQLERQWLTVSWAMEGVALIWLFYRVPHPGLRATGVVLLCLAFVRLAMNPAILAYQRNSEMRLLNWYLYSYGIVTVCLLVAARMLSGSRRLVWNANMQPVLYTLGGVLAFLLVNIEIADYFAEGPTLTFQFSGNFARDMTYSIAWALFALTLLVIGIRTRSHEPRYAAIGLLFVTLMKLFIHDLSALGQLYRIGAFIVVALILMFASFLYQRFMAAEARASGSNPPGAG